MAATGPGNQVIQRFGGLFSRVGRALGAPPQRKAIDAKELNGLSAISRSMPLSTLATKPSESSWSFQIPSVQISPLSPRENELRFQRVLHSADYFKDCSSDLFEALLWEPLFSGHAPRSTRELETLQLSLFGAKLWYRDLVIVPMLRDSAPMGEIVASPGSRREGSFHIYRAFAARGCTKNERNIELFARLFRSDSQGRRVDRFQSQVRAYYNEVGVTPRGLGGRISRAAYWSTFVERFLFRDGLPCLLPSELNQIFAKDSVSEYITRCHSYLRVGLNQVSNSTLMKVRSRRAIQQRALQALQVLNALEERAFVAGRGFDIGYARAALEMYLDILEDAICMLIEKGVQTNSLIRKADLYYSENLCSYFQGSHIRARLFEPRDMLKYALEGLDFLNRSRPSSRLLEYAIIAAQGNDVSRVAEHELVRDTWSLPLGQIDPRLGKFGEIFPRKEVV